MPRVVYPDGSDGLNSSGTFSEESDEDEESDEACDVCDGLRLALDYATEREAVRFHPAPCSIFFACFNTLGNYRMVALQLLAHELSELRGEFGKWQQLRRRERDRQRREIDTNRFRPLLPCCTCR